MRRLATLLFVCVSLFTQPAWALFGNDNAEPSFGGNNNGFVPVDQAFPFNYYQQDGKVLLDWQVKEGYYLYQHSLSFTGQNLAIGSVELEDGQPHQDEFFGEVSVYTQPLFVQVPLQNYQDGSQLIVKYQGCAEAGFCYPPETRVIDIAPFEATGSSDTATDTASNQANTSPEVPSPKVDVASNTTPQSSAPVSKEASLADKLGDTWWTPLLFLALGVGLAFTPCVLPMYPILTGIVLGGGKLSQGRALMLSFIYVQGMALTYTLLGLVVASAGMQFQAAMQHPYVLIALSVLFVALAMSMFGVYNLQLPSSIQTWLNNQSNKQQGGNTLGVFAMGAISGLVCSPCTTAPLSGALLYVAQSGDLFTGAIALYALAMGMGIPLILVAVFGNKLLPKAGSWMDKVKIVFGFILLAAPIFLLERIIPELWATVLWSGLGFIAFGWLYHSKNALPFGGWKQSAVGIIAMLGLFASAQPALNYWFAEKSVTVEQQHIQFARINTVEELEIQLIEAKKLGKPVMLDFYADWCVACKEFEKYTFHQADVENKLSDFVLLQADVTRNMPQDIELLKQLQVLGLPTIEFWDGEGNHVPNARVTGFMPADVFLKHMQDHQL
ncbi:protein-disulfide reductase DsbD [Vibrio sp. 10N.261.46.E12]|uniref:protein-disulfide reductase DsbD n=1 Tax=unclassified Vibrio TaxID=2614977 RepID=UPI000975E5BD|nr:MULTISPECIES: protein-disulfide reductase DsbD [unclassified Vibrio]OMO34424.1 protein-disulfide reductase DsbD [Vibrio sp. 10N.261.45.E1]PMJ36081.1 protein-disulfide reductase DsbD [Vibrio sp. 10N.286.45.B6]PML92015.1 protein-disulfide reductase DsbD [Vibrio sp. 10N.261.49.E11]PMM74244.1 protein-disulfide reductase DsbD [Vibrio sp. 10N.261.46.F12]PMM89872.1 protein-disulfide reductase DsbD [Vibrio sp. 10N.261.46.E8]